MANLLEDHDIGPVLQERNIPWESYMTARLIGEKVGPEAFLHTHARTNTLVHTRTCVHTHTHTHTLTHAHTHTHKHTHTHAHTHKHTRTRAHTHTHTTHIHTCTNAYTHAFTVCIFCRATIDTTDVKITIVKATLQFFVCVLSVVRSLGTSLLYHEIHSHIFPPRW